jgi:hypothetical protein
MISLAVIIALVAYGLVAMYNRRIVVWGNRTVTGWPVYVLAIVFLAAAGIAEVAGQSVARSRGADEADWVYWWTLLGVPAAAMLLTAVAASKANR